MTRLSMILLLAVVLCLIPSSARSGEPYGVPFQLAVGESTPVGGDGLVAGFAEILGDSRCPTGVVCFWPGDAAASLWLDIPNCPRQEFVLHTYYDFDRSIDLCHAVVHLLQVDPYPHIDGPPIDPLDYVVTLMVQASGPTDTEPSTWGGLKALYR